MQLGYCSIFDCLSMCPFTPSHISATFDTIDQSILIGKIEKCFRYGRWNLLEWLLDGSKPTCLIEEIVE